MDNVLKTKGVFDEADLYNYLSLNGVLKDVKHELISGEEGYTSDYFKEWKNSLFSKLLHGSLKLEILGEYNIHNDPTVLLKASCENGLYGIVDIRNFRTVVPLKYCAIRMINIADDKVVFITDRIDKNEHKVLHSLYSMEGKLIIEDCIDITPTYSEHLKFDVEDRQSRISDMTFSLQTLSFCNEVLVKKRFNLFTNNVIGNLVENAENCEIDVVYNNEKAPFSLYENLKYGAYRTKKKIETSNEKNIIKAKELANVDVELVIKTELLKRNNEKFIEKYLPEHKIFPYFFNKQIFNIEEDK